jgi:hypothetical protein
MEKNHPIYNAVVPVFDQRDCDKARRICEKYSIPTWVDKEAGFEYVDNQNIPTYLQYNLNELEEDYIGFYISLLEKPEGSFNIVSIEEFKELAKTFNQEEDDTIESIIAMFKEAIK